MSGSPLDGLVEDANLGLRVGRKAEPHNSYNFKILTGQAAAASGGAHPYLLNGYMIAGHVMVAWPAKYGESGMQTFICRDGVVYQKDLGGPGRPPDVRDFS